MDIDCGNFLPQNLNHAVSSGAVSEDNINTALFNLFSVQYRLGMFDPVEKQPYLQINCTQINTFNHQQLALEASREGITLLKNLDEILPFEREIIKTLAVVGPNANATRTMQDTLQYNYQKGVKYRVQILLVLKKTCNAAKSADATAIIVGLDESQKIRLY
eukprot:TRINITY_DN3434_c1_g2_i1.p1 TRINITY_DN3434_c1_g2~~TRINITY_DN3434_c1_g2_i1.p1  ORF type:complete len:161 (+),score=22.43 TRINITY_DN3434_c1_g2_i1:778-1260(+)